MSCMRCRVFFLVFSLFFPYVLLQIQTRALSLLTRMNEEKDDTIKSLMNTLQEKDEEMEKLRKQLPPSYQPWEMLPRRDTSSDSIHTSDLSSLEDSSEQE